MRPAPLLLIAATLSALLLAGCGASSFGSSRGTSVGSGNGSSGGGNPTGNPIGGGGGATGSDDAVVATPSVSGTVSVVAGGSRDFSISFTSSDGRAISGFGINGSLDSLPAGWRGPTKFVCAKVSTGSGCVLDLTYAPTVVTSGSLSLKYVFVDNTGLPKTGGTLTIPYMATPQNNVVATASPTGQVAAVVGGGTEAVTVTFNTDDGTPATNLAVTTGLSALPAGWHAAGSTFTCASVSTGSGCQLALSFTPTSGGSGTLALGYSYSNNAGVAKTGTVNIAYAATVHDNVTGTVAPSGQINATVGGTQGVSVTFGTDDGLTATALSLTLPTLPAGWSSTVTTLTCTTVSSGTGCRLPLTYAPTAVASGTLSLPFSYFDNSGDPKTGTVAITYRGTTSDNVVGAASPSSLAVTAGSSTSVTVTFTTDDGNPATDFAVTTDLTALPGGWSSGSSSLACATVSTGSTCQLSLTYAPTAVGSGTLGLAYGYLDNSGTAKAGTVAIPYDAAPVRHLYITQFAGSSPNGADGVYQCTIDSVGALTACTATASGVHNTTGIAFYGGSRVYITDYAGNDVKTCMVLADGSLSACASAGGTAFYSPFQLAISGNSLYVTDGDNAHGFTTCAIQMDGSLTGCTATAGIGDGGLAASTSYAYIGTGSSQIDVCDVGTGGILQNCAASGGPFTGPGGITLSGGYAYVANFSSGAVSVCALGSTGRFSACADSAVGSQVSGVAFHGSTAYVDDASGIVYACSVGSNGALSACTSAATGFAAIFQIAVR